MEARSLTRPAPSLGARPDRDLTATTHAILAALLAAALGLLAGSGLLPERFHMVLVLLVLNASLGAVGYARHGTIFHPGLLLGALTLLSACLGLALYPLVAEHGPNPLIGVLAGTELATLKAFLVFALAAILVSAVAPSAPLSERKLRIEIAEQSRAIRLALTGFVVLAAAAFVSGSDIPALFSRDSYQGFAEGLSVEAFRFGNAMHIPATLVAWVMVLSHGTRRVERFAAGVALFVFVLMDFATASRSLGLIPLLLLVAYMLTRAHVPPFRLILWSAMLAVVCVSAALYLRGTDDHGLAGYARTVVEEPADVVLAELPTELANFSVGFPLASYVITYGNEVDPAGVGSSLNPLLSRQLGHDPSDVYRVTAYMPYSAVGTLARLGTGFGFAYFAIVSGILSALWWYGHRSPSRAAIARPLLVGSSFIIGVMALQYALRATTRVTMVVLVALPVMLALSSRSPPAAPLTNPRGATGAAGSRSSV